MAAIPEIVEIRKRDGRIEPFQPEKIEVAISKAFAATHTADGDVAHKLAEQVVDEVKKRWSGRIPRVEDVQDVVEQVLMEADYPEVAKAYILYRKERAELRDIKQFIGVTDDLKLGVNAISVLKRRYLLKNEQGDVVETPSQLFRRVARTVAAPDAGYGASEEEVRKAEEEFYRMMASREFMPNSPTLMNAGTEIGQLAACFVLPVEDSMEGIFESLKDMALIHQSGGGTGFSFSRLRPKGDLVKSTMGIASGPISFMNIYDEATNTIKQGGRRRGANMGILRVDHPDILEFITSKTRPGVLSNFNISVGITEKFMQAVIHDEEYELINPRSRQVVKKLRAGNVFDLIVSTAWQTGDPGLAFIDRINASNPTPDIGPIESTNPCVTGDARLSTSFGMVKMRELYESGEVLRVVSDRRGTKYPVDSIPPVDLGLGTDVLKAAPVFMTSKDEAVYKLVTEHGYEIKATGYHKFITPHGRKELRELKPGDTLLIQSGEGSFGKEGSEELGLVLGWLAGDGCISGNRVHLYFYGEKDRACAQVIADATGEIVNALVPVGENGRNYSESRIAIIRSKTVERVTIKSRRLKRLLEDRYGVTAENRTRVPEVIWHGSRETVASYIRALFTADGTVCVSLTKQSCDVRLAQSDHVLLQEIQMLLLNFGIVSKLHERRQAGTRILPDGCGGSATFQCRADFELIIGRESRDRFMREIGFMLPAKQDKLMLFVRNKARKTNRETFETRVKWIEYAGREPVYDTTEPLTHTISINGIVTGNCGEVPLLPYESCNLASINLERMVVDGNIDWDKLKRLTVSGVHFLDNVIDATRFPLPQVKKMQQSNRKIGLGVMGFADMLIKLGIPYDTDEALATGERVMEFINQTAQEASRDLAEKRGPFPNFKGSIWDKPDLRAMRNATVTSVAPTGTISIIAGTSSGIEPLFAVAFVREVMEGTRLVEVNPQFEAIAKERGFYSRRLMLDVAKHGSVQSLEDISPDVRRLFVTSMDIDPVWHVKMQAVFQKHVDNAVAKTVNLPREATPEDVRKIYMLAYELGCKGITIYRYGSKPEQVLYVGPVLARELGEDEIVSADSEFAGGCPSGACPF